MLRYPDMTDSLGGGNADDPADNVFAPPVDNVFAPPPDHAVSGGWRTRRPRRSRRWAYWSAIALMISGSVASLVTLRLDFRGATEPSVAMEPALHPGDKLLAVDGAAVRRGDIIIFTFALPRSSESCSGRGGCTSAISQLPRRRSARISDYPPIKPRRRRRSAKLPPRRRRQSAASTKARRHAPSQHASCCYHRSRATAPSHRQACAHGAPCRIHLRARRGEYPTTREIAQRSRARTQGGQCIAGRARHTR